jgi:hypothetical protein
MSEKKVPEPLQNLVRDLRDRRLLPIVIVLIVALIAIPVLLATDPEAPAPTSATLSSADAAAGIDGAEITDPVVLAEVPGIRNFHERLDRFRKQNPFEQQLTGVPKSLADAQAKAEAEAKQAIGDAGGSGAGTADAGNGATGTHTPTQPADPRSSRTHTGGSSGTTTKTYGYFWKIDAKVGVVGDAKQKTGIDQLEFLPGKSHPVVQFIQGVGESAAIFVVSRSVGDTHGDGKCRPHPDNCQFVALEVGKSQTFRYEPDGLQYKIKLTGVHLERREIDPKDAGQMSGDGLDAFLSGG